MLSPWYNYKGHEAKLVGKRKKVDNNIYSFDIETTSYLILYGEQKAGIEYEFLSEKEQDLLTIPLRVYFNTDSKGDKTK